MDDDHDGFIKQRNFRHLFDHMMLIIDNDEFTKIMDVLDIGKKTKLSYLQFLDKFEETDTEEGHKWLDSEHRWDRFVSRFIDQTVLKSENSQRVIEPYPTPHRHHPYLSFVPRSFLLSPFTRSSVFKSEQSWRRTTSHPQLQYSRWKSWFKGFYIKLFSHEKCDTFKESPSHFDSLLFVYIPDTSSSPISGVP